MPWTLGRLDRIVKDWAWFAGVKALTCIMSQH